MLELQKMLLRDFWNAIIFNLWLVVHNTRMEE